MAVALLAIAWLVGLTAAAFSDGDWLGIVGAASFVAAASFAYITRPKRRRRWNLGTLAIIVLAVVTVFLAGWRYTSADGSDLSLARYNNRGDVHLRGVITSDPDYRETTTQYRFDVSEVSTDDEPWHEDSGAVLIFAPAYPEYSYGDELEIATKLEAPPSTGDFNYADYLASRGISSLANYPGVLSVDSGHGDWLRRSSTDIRSRLNGSLEAILPEPHSSLAAGILFGERSSIPDDLLDDMRDTGTSHLVAVSGQNVTIVAAMVLAGLAWLIGRRPAAWVSLAAIAGYTILVGPQPSVIRAAVMGAVYVLATISGRQQTSVIALALAASIMTAIDPTIIDDVSFQLSFAATFGLATFASPLNRRLIAATNRSPTVAEFPLTRPAVELFSVTLAAVLFTLPVSAVYFGQVSLIAPVANLLAVPAFLFVAIAAGIGMLVDLVAPARYGTLIAWPPAEYMIEVIRLFARVPGASVQIGGFTRWHAAGMFAVLVAAAWLLSRPFKEVEAPKRKVEAPRRAVVPALGVATLILLVAATGALLLSRPERGKLSVTFLDVGQGDAILIEGPAGSRVLVDGGPGALPIARALSRNLPFDDRRIDLVVLTHPQSDHMSGLVTVLDRYDVGGVIDTAVSNDSSLYRTWEDEIRTSGAHVTSADRAETIDLGLGASLQVLGPTASDPLLPKLDLNTASTVLRVSMGDTAFLLTGDLDDVGERALIRSGADLSATVLKVGHHGSKTSTTPAFLARVQPAVAVIEVGGHNSFGHPAQETLERLSSDLVLRTDQDGDVTITTDGSRIWVER
jgi:competence protein ComEC